MKQLLLNLFKSVFMSPESQKAYNAKLREENIKVAIEKYK